MWPQFTDGSVGRGSASVGFLKVPCLSAWLKTQGSGLSDIVGRKARGESRFVSILNVLQAFARSHKSVVSRAPFRFFSSWCRADLRSMS